MNTGIFCLSIDLELLWGRRDTNYSRFIEKSKNERHIIKNLLKLFNKYDIHATWAIVGKLYEAGDPLWHCPDIINLIKLTKHQEIASHSYSHPEFTAIPPNVAKEEFKKHASASFVFPRNKISYLNLLRDCGFICFRGEDKRRWELLYPAPPPAYTPTLKAKLVNIPGSMYFVSSRDLRKFIPYGLRFLKSKMGIDQAIKHTQVFHLWFHPVDFADNETLMMKELEAILVYVQKKVQDGKLLSLSMQEIASSYLSQKR